MAKSCVNVVCKGFWYSLVWGILSAPIWIFVVLVVVLASCGKLPSVSMEDVNIYDMVVYWNTTDTAYQVRSEFSVNLTATNEYSVTKCFSTFRRMSVLLGVTKHLQWARVVDGLDLLDAPGILPMRIADQAGATRLAICNDIGENSYAVPGVAAVLVEMLKRIPTAGPQVLGKRYKMENVADMSGEFLLEEIAQAMFQGNVNQAAQRVLRDFRKGEFGWIALESPPSTTRQDEEEYDNEEEFEIR